MYWYQNDHLGTPRELTSNSGNIEWEAVYQAWGNTVTVEWQEVAQSQQLNPIQLNDVDQAYLLQPHRFQGQIYDNETGLHYNRFRYYDPDAGRFISHDPIGLMGGDNHFQYAPNPIIWIDSLGLEKKRSHRKPQNVSTKSIGSTVPRNKNESFAMDHVKKHSENGTEIISKDKIGDPCFKDKGWAKYEQKINDVVIHYMAKVEKGIMKFVTDFKYKR